MNRVQWNLVESSLWNFFLFNFFKIVSRLIESLQKSCSFAHFSPVFSSTLLPTKLYFSAFLPILVYHFILYTHSTTHKVHNLACLHGNIDDFVWRCFWAKFSPQYMYIDCTVTGTERQYLWDSNCTYIIWLFYQFCMRLCIWMKRFFLVMPINDIHVCRDMIIFCLLYM